MSQMEGRIGYLRLRVPYTQHVQLPSGPTVHPTTFAEVLEALASLAGVGFWWWQCHCPDPAAGRGSQKAAQLVFSCTTSHQQLLFTPPHPSAQPHGMPCSPGSSACSGDFAQSADAMIQVLAQGEQPLSAWHSFSHSSPRITQEQPWGRGLPGLQSLNPMGNPFLQAELILIAFLLQHLEGLGPEANHPLFMDLRLWCYIVVVISLQGLWERRKPECCRALGSLREPCMGPFCPKPEIEGKGQLKSPMGRPM